jgi:hypothetical protein
VHQRIPLLILAYSFTRAFAKDDGADRVYHAAFEGPSLLIKLGAALCGNEVL